MADIYDMNQAINKPNVWASFQQGKMLGQQQKAYQQAEQDRNALRNLAPQIIAGDPAAYDQAAVIDPKAAGQYQDAGDTQLRRMQGALKLIDSATDPRQKEAYYQQVRPYFARMSPNGVPPPATYAEAAPHFEKAKAQIAMLENSQPQGAVQSTYIDADENRVAIMRDGSTAILGQNAPQNQIIDTGQGFYGVNKGTLQAAPVMIGGQSAAPQGASTGEPPSEPARPDEEQIIAQATAMLQPGMPADQIDAWVAQQLELGANAYQPAQGQQLASAPKASEALAVANLQGKQARTLTPDETKAAGFREGTIVQVDGFGNQKVVQAPGQDRQSMSNAERKDMLARKAKIPQLQNAIRGMDRIEQALAGLDGALLNTGPLDAQVQRFTPAGQELDSAVGSIQNSILALTRVPGIGAQSDLEARIAALQYPSLDKPPEVNRRTLNNLKLFMRDLAKAYQGAMQQDAGTAPASSSGNDADGDGVDGLLQKYGVQ